MRTCTRCGLIDRAPHHVAFAVPPGVRPADADEAVAALRALAPAGLANIQSSHHQRCCDRGCTVNR